MFYTPRWLISISSLSKSTVSLGTVQFSNPRHLFQGSRYFENTSNETSSPSTTVRIPQNESFASELTEIRRYISNLLASLSSQSLSLLSRIYIYLYRGIRKRNCRYRWPVVAEENNRVSHKGQGCVGVAKKEAQGCGCYEFSVFRVTRAWLRSSCVNTQPEP